MPDTLNTETEPNPTDDADSGMVTALIVLGMHRSGTSALARLVSLLGAELPKTLMGASEANRSGHWESQHLVDLNETILDGLNHRWDDWRKIDLAQLSGGEHSALIDRIRDGLSSEYSLSGTLVLKDPRVCRLFDLYRPAFEDLSIAPKILFAYRNPLDVARSLQKRDDIPIELGQLYWLRYVLDAEAKSRHLPRAFINFDTLLAGWSDEIDRVSKTLDVFTPEEIAAQSKTISDFLDPDAQSFADGSAQLSSDPRILQMSREVFATIEKMAKAGEGDDCIAGLESIRSEFDILSMALDRQIGALESESRKAKDNAATARTETGTLIGSIARLNDQLASKDKEIQSVHARLADAIAETTSLGEAVEKAQAVHQSDLKDARAEFENKSAIAEKSWQQRLELSQASLDEAESKLRNTETELRRVTAEHRRSETYWDQEGRVQSTRIQRLAARNTDLARRLSDQETQINGLHARLSELDQSRVQMSEHITALEATNSTLRASNENLVSSTSWRLSKPIRQLGYLRFRMRERACEKLILGSGLFDEHYYRTQYPDYKASGLSPIRHFIRHGGAEGRNPSDRFDCAAYLAQNPDLQNSGMNPLIHYLEFGRAEARMTAPHDTPVLKLSSDRKAGRGRYKVDASVLHDLTVEDTGPWGVLLQSLGTDPQLHLQLYGPGLAPGQYELSGCHPRGGIAFQNPTLYVDKGGGFHDHESVHLAMTYRGDRWSTLINLPEGAIDLRLDPLVSAAKISLGDVQLRRLSRAGYYWRMISRLVRGRIQNPAAAIESAKNVIRSLRRGGLRQLRADLALTHSLDDRRELTYEDWISSYDTLSEADKLAIARRIKKFDHQPKISVVMPVYNTPPDLLRDCIESVRGQLYPHWELCIANDKSTDAAIAPILDEYARTDDRIKVVHREENGHISKASNSALELASGEWIALLDHDDLLAPHALYHVAEAINRAPKGRLFYSDEDKIDLEGRRHDPYFKCDWNHHLFLSHNLITHLGVYSKALVDEIGGFQIGVEGAQDWDLALRCVARLTPDEIIHIPFVLYHWRVMPGSTALDADEKPYALIAAQKSVEAFLTEKKIEADVIPKKIGLHVRYALPQTPPKVSILIPTRNGLDLVRQCINSIERLTTYPDYEIVLVDNGSDDADALAYFEKLSNSKRAKVIRDDRPFNYSALNNGAIPHCSGDMLCLLNNDIEVITPDWLEEMVSTALQDNVGAVGAMLYYPDDTIQHAGVVMGLGGMAGHVHAHFPKGSMGYVGRAGLKQSFSAVTAACLLVSRGDYLKVGGLNETDLTVAYNDVDFCLKLKQLGKDNVWTPAAELYHYESATRGSDMTGEKRIRFEKEKEYMRNKWPDIIAHDPAYSPNLTANFSNFAISFPPRIEKPWKGELT